MAGCAGALLSASVLSINTCTRGEQARRPTLASVQALALHIVLTAAGHRLARDGEDLVVTHLADPHAASEREQGLERMLDAEHPRPGTLRERRRRRRLARG
ncbi:hypothetical protein [Kitasatospora sp. GP82]|uniref:hypothetical protein n=1 Tax=Kitasatospora sp. GP82 TaxID=3035089 RepID=UPI0024745913|nr:hypothetical protein [Kitasatospora sp. GP82]MDH6123471.1 hypothetical protein [Kitasatospora sp. GP82]